MADFYSGTSLYWVGFYLGGTNVGGCDSHADHAWVSGIDDTGYGSIPIWDTKYAPCFSGGGDLMSWDGDTAFGQGKDAADNAVDKAKTIGFSQGSIIADDQEGYGASAGSLCAQAVDHFVNGWSKELQNRGWKAVAYGSGCSSNVDNWWSVSNPPNDAWIAAWDNSNPHPSVFASGMCVPDGHWHDNRYHQYTANQNITHGGTTIQIDKDCARGGVAGSNAGLSVHDDPDCA